MADQQSRGGKKQGGNDPQDPQRHQTTGVNRPRPASDRPSDQGYKPGDESKDDEAMAPESGNRKATGND